MKRHAIPFFAIIICAQLVATGCINLHPAAKAMPAAGSDTPSQQPVEKPANSNSLSSQQALPSSSAAETTAAALVPNPIYHPGKTDELQFSGKFEGKKTITVSGKITLIVTKEESHGKNVNVMNSVLELIFPDGKRHQIQSKSVYATEKDGSLKILYKESGTDVRWVESNTCAREPADFIDGHTDGCEVHYDDGSTEKSTSTVTRDGDYLKVTWLSANTDAKGEHDSSETYWFDISNGHIVRYAGVVTLADGSQMTIKGH